MPWTLSAFADEAGPSAEEQITALQQDGYRYIDVRSIDGYNVTELPEANAKEVRAKLDAAGITVAMFGSPIGKIDIADDFDLDLNKLNHLGKIKDLLGCNRVRMFSYRNKGGMQEDQWRDETLDRLRRLTERADQLGLELFHENEHGIFGDVCDRVELLASELRGARFRLIFDFDNYNRCGDDVWQNWTRLADKTDAFHLKDSNAEGMHVPVGEGSGQVREILADAVKRGWDGPLSLEPHLARSQAVLATGPGGKSNEALKDMTTAQSFQVAATTAKQLLTEIGAPFE